MRRIISISLLGLLLCNTIGYSMVSLSEEEHSNSYRDKDHICLIRESAAAAAPAEVPLTGLYQTKWKIQEARESKIGIPCQFYRVKNEDILNKRSGRRYEPYQNTKDRFNEFLARIKNQISGLYSQQEDNYSHIRKNFLNEYMVSGTRWGFSEMELEHLTKLSFIAVRVNAIELHFKVPSPPPDSV